MEERRKRRNAERGLKPAGAENAAETGPSDTPVLSSDDTRQRALRRWGLLDEAEHVNNTATTTRGADSPAEPPVRDEPAETEIPSPPPPLQVGIEVAVEEEGSYQCHERMREMGQREWMEGEAGIGDSPDIRQESEEGRVGDSTRRRAKRRGGVRREAKTQAGSNVGHGQCGRAALGEPGQFLREASEQTESKEGDGGEEVYEESLPTMSGEGRTLTSRDSRQYADSSSSNSQRIPSFHNDQSSRSPSLTYDFSFGSSSVLCPPKSSSIGEFSVDFTFAPGRYQRESPRAATAPAAPGNTVADSTTHCFHDFSADSGGAWTEAHGRQPSGTVGRLPLLCNEPKVGEGLRTGGWGRKDGGDRLLSEDDVISAEETTIVGRRGGGRRDGPTEEAPRIGEYKGTYEADMEKSFRQKWRSELVDTVIASESDMSQGKPVFYWYVCLYPCPDVRVYLFTASKSRTKQVARGVTVGHTSDPSFLQSTSGGALSHIGLKNPQVVPKGITKWRILGKPRRSDVPRVRPPKMTADYLDAKNVGSKNLMDWQTAYAKYQRWRKRHKDISMELPPVNKKAVAGEYFETLKQRLAIQKLKGDRRKQLMPAGYEFRSPAKHSLSSVLRTKKGQRGLVRERPETELPRGLAVKWEVEKFKDYAKYKVTQQQQEQVENNANSSRPTTSRNTK
eukprot:GHVQ01024002.1.p1 GENE.GHVQ01024002.1~~GHVQ01024002.1.p1  ORF type:complete len:677 (-),score=96.33 GHVQ01024002.1:1404-3434(-)